jgi:hypothetical protein
MFENTGLAQLANNPGKQKSQVQFEPVKIERERSNFLSD